MSQESNIFELTICGLMCQDNTACDVVLDCANENIFNIIVGKANDIYDTVYVKSTVVSVDVKKRIGTHNHIAVRLKFFEIPANGDVTHISVSSLKNTLLRREVKLSAVIDDETFAVAERYYVFGAKPVFKKVDSTFYVDLDIYSWDKFMDIARYSKTYQKKRLGTDIINGEKGLLSGYTNAPICDTSGMRVLLRETEQKSESDNSRRTKQEIAFPYLEQYDETEYNFLLRTANRCGEFFYFENGVLNLGLTRVMQEDNQEAVTSLDETYYASVESLTEDTFDGDMIDSFNQDITEINKVENTPYTPVVSNECNGKFVSAELDTKDKWKSLYPPAWSRAFAKLFQSENCADFLLSWSFSELAVKNYTTFQPRAFNDNVVKPYNEKKDDGSNGGGSSQNPEEPVVMGEYIPDYEMFKVMNKAEMVVSNNQFLITFDDRQMNLRLGDLVTCSGIGDEGRFVVVDIHSKYLKDETVKPSRIINRMEVTVIPVYDDCPIPLPADIENKEEQKPVVLNNALERNGITLRVATVEVSDDPYRLNQVRVYFDDQKKGSSPSRWMKVLTPFATSDESGISCKLNKGDKVLVAEGVLNGTVYESFVVGSFFDNQRVPPYGQRKYSTVIRSNNGHLIAFNDQKEYGKSLFTKFLPFLKIFNFMGLFGVDSSVTTEERTEVTKRKDESDEAFKKRKEENDKKNKKIKSLEMSLGGIDITDNYGLYSISTSSDQRAINIDSPFGTVGISAAMGITVTAPNGNVKIVGKNVDIVAGNNLTLKSGANIDNWLSSLGTSSGRKNYPKSELKSVKSYAKALFDISALRFAIELLFKPVQGTLKIHSGRYLMLEAGEGEATLPDAMKGFPRCNPNYTETILDADKHNAEERVMDIKKKIDLWSSLLNTYKSDFILEYSRICQLRTQLIDRINLIAFKRTDVNIVEKVDSWIADDNKGQITKDDYKAILNIDAIDEDKTKEINTMVAHYKVLKLEIKQLLDANWGTNIFANNILFSEKGKGLSLARNIINETHSDFKKFNINSKDVGLIMLKSNQDQNKVFREGIVEILNKIDLLNYTIPADCSNAEQWKTFVESIKPKKKDSNFWTFLLNTVVPLETFNQYAWSPEAKGAILMSQNEGSTLHINGESIKENFNYSLKAVKETIKTASI